MILINCSRCRTPLQLPTGAAAIRCSICGGTTVVTAPPPHSYPSPAAALQPAAFSRKRAVICGISYKNTAVELEGCINDAKCMKYLLVNRFNFPDSSILMLTDEETDIYKRPTKHIIRMALHWLMQGVQAGDSLVFHFSGHGSQQRNYNGDEIDGFDELLHPLDYETAGMIIDDELNATIVRPLPYGAKLHAIIDSCNSGTMLDLPFLRRMYSGNYTWEDHRPPSGVYKGTNGGEVISFSGCDDHQTAEDTQAMSKVTTTGAMTFSFINAIERGQATTYGNLLNSMRSNIRNNDLNSRSNNVLNHQEPQLTAHTPFDVYMKPFSL